MRIAAALVCLVAIAASANAQPVIEKQVIVQGSVGQPGREHAYLNIQNADQVDVTVSVQYVRPLPHAPILRSYTVSGEDRRSIDLRADVPELLPNAYFSVIATISAADELPTAVVIDLTWHRASDFQEVESRTAVVRQSPKR